MFYNGSKIRGRSAELVGALFKGPRLKLAIGGVILLAVAVTATLAGIFTNISEAQSQPPDLIGFDQSVYRVTEGETLNLTVNTSMGGMPNNAAGGLLYIETTVKDGTAKAGIHFPTLTNGIFFELDDTKASDTFSLQTIDNDVLDGPQFKNFFVEIITSAPVGFQPPEAGFEFDPNRIRAEIIIEDDDMAGIGFVDPADPDGGVPAPHIAVVNDFTSTVTVSFITTVPVTVGVLDGTIPVGSTVTLLLKTADGSVETELNRLAAGGITETHLTAAGINREELVAKAGIDYDAIPDTDIELTSQSPTATVEIPIRILTTDNNDDVLSPDKIFNIVLSVKPDTSLPDGFTLDPDRSRTDVAIRDNEIAVGFEERSYSIREGMGSVEVCVAVSHPDSSGNIPLTGGSSIIGVVTTEAGTASELDYTRRAGFDIALFFDNAGRRECFDIDITDDNIVDGSLFEEFYLNLKNDPFTTPVLGYDSFDPIRNRVKITIEDKVLIGFEQTEYTVREGTDLKTVLNVRASHGPLHTNATANINFNTMDDTAISGADFDGVSNQQITFNNQNGSEDVDVNILNDAVIEAMSESFTVVLSPRGNLPAGVALDPNRMTAVVTIEDDDKATFGLDSPRFGVFESDGSVRITIDLLAGALDTPIPVNYRIEPGSARNGDDYTGAMEGTVIFNVGGERSQFIDIPIINDNVPEAHESFRVVLSDGPQIELATAEALVEILNDDIATIRFDQPSYTASEAGANPNIGIISDVALPAGFTLTVSTIVGSAMAGEDYTALDNKEAFLPDGYTTGYIENVSITDDNLIELDETFEVVLSAPYGLPPGVELAPLQSRVPVKIESEDTARVVFVEDSYEVNEDAGSVDVEIEFEDGVMLGDDLNVTVYYGITQAVTTATAGEDYELATRDSVVLTAVNTQATIRIPILNDDLFEGDEAFGIVLLGSSHPRVQATGNTEVTIKDDDSVTVGFIGPASYTVNEGDGSVAVTFGITGNTKLANNETVEFQYATFANPNSASANEDYTDIDLTPVVLTADNPEVTVWIPITNDTTPEGDESFTFAIAPHADFGGTSLVVITITDDDPPGTIGFPNEPGAIEEVWENDGSGLIRINVQTSPSLSDTFTLNYVIEPGTAASTAASTATSEDYMDTVLDGVLRLKPNTKFHQLSIRLNDDSIAEGAESLFVRLVVPDGTTLPTGFSLTNATQEVIILDDDSTLLGFGTDLMETELESYVHRLGGVGLGVGLGALTSQEGEIGHTITLNYVVEAGSAILGEDYGQVFSTRRIPDLDVNGDRKLDVDGSTIFVDERGPITGTIKFFPTYPGETDIVLIRPGDYNIVIPFMNDVLVENDEKFTVRLSVPEGTPLPPNTFLYKDSVEITIQNDDDVEINFNDAPEVVVHEDHVEAPVSIAVQSTPKFAENTTVTVGYEIRGGSAQVGQDYTGTDGTLIFVKDPIAAAFDQPFVVLRIPIIDDDLFELNSAGFNEETFTVTIFHLNEPPISGLSFGSTELKVSIIDNDLPDITLRSETGQWIEGMAGTLRASIPDPLAVDLELTIIPVFDDMDPATVDADDGDYRGASTVTIPAGDRSVVIEASIHDDNTVEVDKVLNVTVSQFNHIGLTNPHIYQLAARPSASITIVDDDPLTLNLEVQESNQEADTVQATVKFVTTSSFEFTGKDRPQVVTLELRDANGELYTGRIDGQDIGGMGRQSYYGSPIPFTPQDLTTQDDITLYFENNFYEGQRAYTLELLKTPTQHPGIMLGTASADITVAENDLPALALNYGGNREVAEGQGIDVELELTNGAPEGLHEPLTVRLALTKTSSASTSDIDFPSTVTIPRDSNSATFRIGARDDMLNGEIEQFELAFVNVSVPSMAEPTTYAVFSSGGAIAVTEAPVPQVTLSLEGGISTIMEGGSVNLIATLAEPLPGGVPEPLTVELAVEGVSDGDYSLPDEIVIPTGGMTGMVELMIDNDNLAEFAEQLTVSVARLGYGTNRVAPQVESSVGVKIELNNNDKITATIMASDLNEAVDAIAMVTIELDRALPDGLADNEVQLVLVNTGDRADDVVGSSWDIATDLGSGLVTTVMIPLMDDMILEGTEVVTLKLAVSDRLKPIFANEDTASGSFNINENEDGTVIIATPVKTAYDESETIGLTVELPPGVNAGAPITVNYKITFPPVGSTAPAEGADITTTSREVTIAANANSVPLTIMLNDDVLLEETELFRVTLMSVSTTNGADVKVGGQSVDLTILDDEDLTYEIEGADKIGEDAGNYTVRLRRTGDITADAMVPYTVDGADVTAADFGGTGMFPSGSFTFMGNEALSADVSIPIADDMILEPDETFQITADKDGAAETSHDVTINDDDDASATVQPLSHYVYQSGASEIGGKTYLEVGLTNAQGGAPAELTIDLMARAAMPNDGGTPSDVTITDESGTEISQVTLATGDTRAIIIIEGKQDDLVEYDETVNIYVSHVNGAEVNTDSGVDLTVTSEDQITVESLRVLGTSTLEEGGMANVEITLSAPLPDLTPANALALVLRDSTYGPDVTIPAADIIPALKADRTTIVTIALDHDALLEADEEIELELEIASGQDPNLADVLNVSVAEARTSFTLADDDSGEVTIEALSKTSYSETDDVMVTVSLPSGLRAGTNIDVDYELVFLLTDDGGTERVAADAADIDGSTSGSVTIMAGDTNTTITIDLEDDTVAEEAELLGVRLTNASGADVTYDNTVMQFLILDDEAPEYTLVGDGTVNESDGSYTVQARRRGRTDVLSVGYTVTVAASDSASAADFTGGAFPVGTFMFSGDTALSTNTAMIGIEDDALLEDVENFLILAGNAMHPVMLFDNDAPTVFVRYTHAVSSVTVNEGEMVPLIAELQNAPGGATEELTVSLLSREVSGVTDSGTPSDVSFPSTVTIPVGASKVTFAVRAVSDGLAEFNERVNIYADGVSYSGGINMTGDNGAELTVVSTDPIVATITIPDGTEGNMIAARITLNQSLPSQTQVGALSLVLEDDSISNDSVRIVSKDIVTDLKNGRTADVMIELKDDMVFRGDVTVNVKLVIDSTLTPDLRTLLPSVARASFKVSDNDPNIIRVETLLSATEYDEGDTVEFEFALPAGITAGIPITVEYELVAPTTDADNNRRAPADPGDRSTVQAQGLAPGFAQGLALPVRGLAQTLQPLVIQTGDNSVILRIQLTDDMTAEETELLGVRLMGVNAGPNARVEVDQRMDETVITILDNEDPVLEILGSGSVNEEDGRYIVRLRRLGRINTMGEKVPFKISGDGADDGDFVGALGGEFVFDGLDALSQLVILTLDDDRSQEDAKTFQIGVERRDPMTNMFVPVDLVDPVTGMPASGFAVTLLDTDVADFFGALPPTGGPVLPVWLILLLALTGVALPLTALKLNR